MYTQKVNCWIIQQFYFILGTCICFHSQFSFIQSLSHSRLFVIPWTAVCQTSLSITNSWSLLKLMSIKEAMPSNHLTLYHPLLLMLSIFPSIRVFSNESVLRMRWPKYQSFSFSTSPFNEYSELISFKIDCFVFLAVASIYIPTFSVQRVQMLHMLIDIPLL